MQTLHDKAMDMAAGSPTPSPIRASLWTRRDDLPTLQYHEAKIEPGVLLSFVAYAGKFYSRLGSMSRIVSAAEKAAAGAKRIFDILDHVSSVPEPADPVPLPKVTGAIELPADKEMVMPGDNVTITVKLINPIAMEEGLRFAIREGGRTVGAGVVAKIIA